MTVTFDRRHRWGEVVRDGARSTRTCSACGISRTYETMLPDSFIDSALKWALAPNPYRRLVAR